MTKIKHLFVGLTAAFASLFTALDGSTVTGNGTGLSALSGGALLSYGNNNVDANGANGAFSGPVALQ